jgi:hypothetical protein
MCSGEGPNHAAAPDRGGYKDRESRKRLMPPRQVRIIGRQPYPDESGMKDESIHNTW